MRRAAPVIGIREPGALDLVQALLRQGVSVRIRVSGDSMRPLLKGGETVELTALAGNSPKLGDVLFLYDKKGNPIVHRLVWRRSRNGALQLLTKGDDCAVFDGFIPADRVLGRVRRIIPDTEPQLMLDAPFLRLRASLIISRTLFFHTLRRLHFILSKSSLSPTE